MVSYHVEHAYNFKVNALTISQWICVDYWAWVGILHDARAEHSKLHAKAVILQLPHSSSTGACMHMTPAMEVTATSYDWNFQKHWSGLLGSESMG